MKRQGRAVLLTAVQVFSLSFEALAAEEVPEGTPHAAPTPYPKQAHEIVTSVAAPSQAVQPMAGSSTAACPITPTTHFGYYNGSGVGTFSGQWMPYFLNWWKSQPGNSGLTFVALSAANVKSDCDLVAEKNSGVFRLYIQPGGSAYEQNVALGAQGKTAINNFIGNGGAYFGACAGFYYASAGYLWKGYDGAPTACAKQSNLCEYSLRLRPATHGNLLGKYPSIVEGPVQELGGAWLNASTVHQGATVLNVGAQRFNAMYWGGPTQGYAGASTPQLDPVGNPLPNGSYPLWTNPLPTSTPAGTIPFATYTGSTSTGPAAVVFNPGGSNGKMLLTSVHLEAHIGQGFGAEAGMTACQEVENYKLLANKINEVAGTTFFVPAYNAGCTVGPYVDGSFEDGTLQGWVPTAGSSGIQIHNSSQQKCGGAKAMFSRNTGLLSDTPGKVEKVISGKSTITFSYKTSGLSGAVEKLQLFRKIGSTWQTTAAWTGAASNSSCAPVQVSVTGATAVRFVCHPTGASDYCAIDDVSFQ